MYFNLQKAFETFVQCVINYIYREEDYDVVYYDAFDPFDLDEQQFEQSDSDDDLGETDSGKKTSFGFGPHPKFSRGDEKYALNEELKMVEEKRFICSLDLLLDMLSKRCQTPGYNNIQNVTHHFIGTTLVANISCQAGHAFRFCSSHEVNQMYVNNIQVAAAVLLSGNNFGKIQRLTESMNLAFVSKSSYFKIKRVYLLPAVDEWWGWMSGQLMEEFRDQEVVCSGEGQCNSPGLSAKNLCYFIMEVTSKYILEVQIVDKRHVGLVSSNMEVEGLKKSLKKL